MIMNVQGCSRAPTPPSDSDSTHNGGTEGICDDSPGADWPHWRGARRNDVIAESSGYGGRQWPIGEPLWIAHAGAGASSPLVVAGRVYTLGWASGQDTVACLDAATGELVWVRHYRCPAYGRRATGDEGLYSGPSSTPEYDPATGLLYTLSTDGDLNCWDTGREGENVWSVNLYEAYAVPRRPKIGRSGLRDYGYTSSPLVWHETVIIEVGDDDGCLMGFDKHTGRRLWTSQSKDPAGHSAGPTPIVVDGVPCVAVMTVRGLLIARIDRGHEGRTVAFVDWATDCANNTVAPCVHGNSVIVTSAYNHSAMARFEITLRGARKVWEQPLSSKVCIPVVFQGHVYWAWQQVHCLDLATGVVRWSGGTFGDAGSCIATCDGKLIVWGHNGKLALVDTEPESAGEYRERACRDDILAAEAWPHVVLAGRRIYCKDRNGNLKCFSLDAVPDASTRNVP